MSGWNHRICEHCWFGGPFGEMELEDGTPVYRSPVALKDPDPGVCCFCRLPVITGIFVRKNPEDTYCSHLPMHTEEEP